MNFSYITEIKRFFIQNFHKFIHSKFLKIVSNIINIKSEA